MLQTRSETAEVTGSVAADANARKTELRTTPAVLTVLLRIEGEYREMPGLSLTMARAQRLWGLDHPTCRLVLAELIERRVLRRASNGTYVRGPLS